jgi:hypothetical protein
MPWLYSMVAASASTARRTATASKSSGDDGMSERWRMSRSNTLRFSALHNCNSDSKQPGNETNGALHPVRQSGIKADAFAIIRTLDGAGGRKE